MKMNLFIPITKIDVEKRLVYGIATAESPDKSGEIMDYESTVPYYKAWSGEIEKSSGGKSLGNLRSMHASVAAGKLTQIHFNDAEKQIEICAKVVDDNEWNKVDEGVYTGFSQGGRYVKTWKDPNDSSLTRYTADPSEVSLVDNPCLASATFEVIKADGATELRKFKNKETPMTETVADGKPVQPKFQPEQVWKASDGKTFQKKEDWRVYQVELEASETQVATDPVVDVLVELEKAVEQKEIDPMTLGKKDFSDERRKKLAETGAALPDGSFPIEDVQDLKNAIHAIGRAKDPAKAKAHIIARAKDLGEESLIPDDWKKKKKSMPAEAMQKFTALAKSETYDVKCALDALCAIESLLYCEEWEAMSGEGEEAQVVDLKEIVSRLKSFIASEIKENDPMEIAEPMQMADKSPMEKAAPDEMKKLGDELTAIKEQNAALLSENAGMKTTLDRVTKDVPALIERIKKLEAQPMPAKGVLYETPDVAVAPVKKGHEAQNEPAAPAEAQLFNGESPEQARLLLNLR